VSRTLPTQRMHEHPDLDQLKRQAKELLRAFLADEPEATVEVHAHYTRPDRTTFALHDAQLVLARSHGFESWPKLKAHVDGVTVRRLADTVRSERCGSSSQDAGGSPRTRQYGDIVRRRASANSLRGHESFA